MPTTLLPESDNEEELTGQTSQSIIDGINSGYESSSPNSNTLPKRISRPEESTQSKPNWLGRTINRLSESPESKPKEPAQNKNVAKPANTISKNAKPTTNSEQVKDKVKTEAKEAAKDVAKKVAKQVAKKAATWAARTIAAMTSETWVPAVVLFIIAIIIAIVVIAALVGVGDSGKITGSRFKADSSENNELKVLADTGSVLERRKLDAADIPKIIEALDKVRVKALAKPAPDDVALIDSIKAKLASYSSSDSKVDRQILTEIANGIATLSGKGYGSSLTRYTTYASIAEVSKLVASDRISLNHDNDRQGLTNGYIPRESSHPGTPDPVPINPMIPLTLLMLNNDFGPMTITSIVGTHPRLSDSGDVSDHWNGNGMDIAIINGEDVLNHKDRAKNMLQWILDHQEDFKAKGIKISQTIGPKEFASLQLYHGVKVAEGGGYKKGHENHVHIGFYPIKGL